MADVIDIDSRRPKTLTAMLCLMCGGRFSLPIGPNAHRIYWPHPATAKPSNSCDEVASVPEWTLQVGR